MKAQYEVQFKTQFEQNAWERLKVFTDARIALGRVGGSLPTTQSLAFQLAHAQAKDAVLKPLDIEHIQNALQKLNFPILYVESCAVDKNQYLKRPDLGRELSELSRQQLQAYQAQHHQEYDVLIVMGDGLSARALEENIPHFIPQLLDACLTKGWCIAPLMIASGSRIALGDEIAEILDAKMLIMLIGERPGLSSPDSMGIYYTYQAKKGCQDAMRNCISNVRAAGLQDTIAIQRLIGLMQKSVTLGYSGVHLKDEHEVVVNPTCEVQSTPRIF